MTDMAGPRDTEAQRLLDEEIAEDRLSARDMDDDDADLEGYDEEQRAEVLEAGQTDPFARDIITNLQPDDGESPLPDEDPTNDPIEDDIDPD